MPDTRYDNVTLGPLLLPARVMNWSHSMYGSSARIDSHRAVFCPNSVVRDRPFNLKGGGYGFLFRSDFFYRTKQELEYLFFLSRKGQFFFPVFNIRLYYKNSSDYGIGTSRYWKFRYCIIIIIWLNLKTFLIFFYM